MLKFVPSVKADFAALPTDIRTVGKIVIATAYAIVVYPGDKAHQVMGCFLLLAGLATYTLGLFKVVEEEKK